MNPTLTKSVEFRPTLQLIITELSPLAAIYHTLKKFANNENKLSKKAASSLPTTNPTTYTVPILIAKREQEFSLETQITSW